MTGDLKHQDIMLRCLDVFFKTISDDQAKKSVLKPDRMNGFEILSEVDAMLERQTELNSRLFKGRRKDFDSEIASHLDLLEEHSVKQALEALQIGQKRKRVGHTILNAESSRSHYVFKMRFVQASAGVQAEYVVQDNQTGTVIQLSLDDLAESERLSRTKSTGQRLRGVGNINSSLMTLRTCLEVFRRFVRIVYAIPRGGRIRRKCGK